MTQTRVSALALTVLTLSLAACSTSVPQHDTPLSSAGIKSAPSITAFTASSTQLPYQGGNVTLNWTTSGATTLSIDQGVGTVTGTTSKTVAVPTTRTFTLTARNKWGTTTRSVTVNVALPITVSGSVRDRLGTPIPNATVTITGHPSITTDATGNFSVPTVAQPYDLTVLDPRSGFTTIYQGATLANPAVKLQVVSDRPYFSDVSGNITGNTTPEAVTTLNLTAGGASSRTIAQDNTYSFTPQWIKGETAAATLHALQSVKNPTTGRIQSYPAYGNTTVKLSHGYTLNGYDVALNPVLQGGIAGNVSFPSGYTPDLQALNITYPRGTASGFVTGGDTYPLEQLIESTANFWYVTPDVAGASFTVIATAAGPNGESVSTYRRDLGARTDGVFLKTTLPPSLVSPAPGVASDTFTWNDNASGLYTLQLFDDRAFTATTVYTQRNQVKLAGTGVQFTPGAQIEWSVNRQQPLVTVDQLLSASTPASEGNSARTQTRTFTAP